MLTGGLRAAGRFTLMRPNTTDRIVELVPTLIAAAVFAGEFLRIRQWWFIPGRRQFGYAEWVARSTVEGTAIAPNQYRPLAPWTAQGIAEGLGVALPTGMLILDAACLVALVAVLHRLASVLSTRPVIVVAALGWGFWASKLDHWHPEVTPLAVVVTLIALLSVERPSWAPAAYLALGAVTLGLRTDYAAGLGLVVLAVGVAQRRWSIAVAGLVVAISAPVATIALTRLYPQAHYIADVVQVPWNSTAGSWSFVLTFYGPALLLPVAVFARYRRLPALWPVVAWFLVEFAATYVVGRVEETRIFLPFSPVLFLAAALAYRTLSVTPTTSPQPGPPPGRAKAALGP